MILCCAARAENDIAERCRGAWRAGDVSIAIHRAEAGEDEKATAYYRPSRHTISHCSRLAPRRIADMAGRRAGRDRQFWRVVGRRRFFWYNGAITNETRGMPT